MFNDQADEDLMVMYQKGDVRAFEVLLSRHRKPVFNFILRFVGDKETAEDLLQEAFMLTSARPSLRRGFTPSRGTCALTRLGDANIASTLRWMPRWTPARRAARSWM